MLFWVVLALRAQMASMHAQGVNVCVAASPSLGRGVLVGESLAFMQLQFMQQGVFAPRQSGVVPLTLTCQRKKSTLRGPSS